MPTKSISRPPAHPVRRWTLDVFITVVVIGSRLPDLVHSDPRVSIVAIVAVCLLTLPILFRRRYPVPVLVWTLLLSVVVGVWDLRFETGLALVVALYTVAALRPRRDGLIAAGSVEVAALIAAGGEVGIAWWQGAILLSGMVAAATGIGFYTATRRAYLAELQDRAERLERERDQQGELAAAAERSRISREMHDIVAHHLTVMVALSDGAVAALAASPEHAAEAMRTVSQTGRRALTDTRRLLGVLRDDTHAQVELQPAPDLAGLDALIERVRAAGLPVNYEIRGADPHLEPGAQLTVYRLIQEALTNTMKHAGAGATASVLLRYSAGELQVDIEDDGRGEGAPAHPGVGGGLIGMRERVHAFGGEIACGPRAPTGWRVSARLELGAPA